MNNLMMSKESVFENTKSLSDLINAVEVLEKEECPNQLKWGISSSVTLHQLGLYLRKQGLLSNTRIHVVDGNYDDPIGDADLFLKNKVDHAIFMPFFDNVMPSFEAQLSCLSEEVISSKEDEIRSKYKIALQKCESFKSVFIGTFHRFSPISEFSGGDMVHTVLGRFNSALRDEAEKFSNVRIIDTEEILKFIGHQNSFDERFYFRSKAPYTSSFLDELAKRLGSATRGFGTHFYKALVLDCDNTLWGGVIGEDLLSGIKLDKHDYPGNIFWKIQNEVVSLEKNGVLLCLCSKNNSPDVDEVLAKHPNMAISNEQIISKKVNWDDKASNIRALAKELNIGLDSMIFLDDSSFECEAVRQQLPMVKTVQVPKNLSEYPKVFSEIKKLFLAGGISEESKSKTQQYRQRSEAETLKAQFSSQDEYLASLGLKVELSRNFKASIPRISELSMKSNQFNLTTRRYSESQIQSMMEDGGHDIYSLIVEDKFGNSGLTGVAVIRYEGKKAWIENFYMSCRVIGRGVEMAIWKHINEVAIEKGCLSLSADYFISPKNSLVSDFYNRLGLSISSITVEGCHYEILTSQFSPPPTPWIELNYVE